MTYNTQEISVAAGQPVELYRFVLGQQVWTVTSGREAITYQVESYQPAVIRALGRRAVAGVCPERHRPRVRPRLRGGATLRGRAAQWRGVAHAVSQPSR